MQQKLIIHFLNKDLEDPKMFCIGLPAQIVPLGVPTLRAWVPLAASARLVSSPPGTAAAVHNARQESSILHLAVRTAQIVGMDSSQPRQVAPSVRHVNRGGTSRLRQFAQSATLDGRHSRLGVRNVKIARLDSSQPQ